VASEVKINRTACSLEGRNGLWKDMPGFDVEFTRQWINESVFELGFVCRDMIRDVLIAVCKWLEPRLVSYAVKGEQVAQFGPATAKF